MHIWVKVQILITMTIFMKYTYRMKTNLHVRLISIFSSKCWHFIFTEAENCRCWSSRKLWKFCQLEILLSILGPIAHSTKYTHHCIIFVLFRLYSQFLVDPYDTFLPILPGCITGTEPIVWLSQCQWWPGISEVTLKDIDKNDRYLSIP